MLNQFMFTTAPLEWKQHSDNYSIQYALFATLPLL